MTDKPRNFFADWAKRDKYDLDPAPKETIRLKDLIASVVQGSEPHKLRDKRS